MTVRLWYAIASRVESREFEVDEAFNQDSYYRVFAQVMELLADDGMTIRPTMGLALTPNNGIGFTLQDMAYFTLARQLYGVNHRWERYSVVVGNVAKMLYGPAYDLSCRRQLFRDYWLFRSLDGSQLQYITASMLRAQVFNSQGDLQDSFTDLATAISNPLVLAKLRQALHVHTGVAQLQFATMEGTARDVLPTEVVKGLPFSAAAQAVFKAFHTNTAFQFAATALINEHYLEGDFNYAVAGWCISALRQHWVSQFPEPRAYTTRHSDLGEQSNILPSDYRTTVWTSLPIPRAVVLMDSFQEVATPVIDGQTTVEEMLLRMRDTAQAFYWLCNRPELLEAAEYWRTNVATRRMPEPERWSFDGIPGTYLSAGGSPSDGVSIGNWRDIWNPDEVRQSRPTAELSSSFAPPLPRWMPNRYVQDTDLADVTLGAYSLNSMPSNRFGIELEFDPGRNSQEFYWEALRSALAPLGQTNIRMEGYMHSDGYSWDLKTDASCGLELATPALTWQNFGLVEVALKALKDAGAVITPACGVHIHHECSNMRVTALRRMLLLWYAYEDVLYSLVRPDRKTNQYCAPIRQHGTFEQLRQALGNQHNIQNTVRRLGKYRSLNALHWWNGGRVEVRMHHGTLQPNTIKLWTAATQQVILRSRVVHNYNALRGIAEMSLPSQYSRFLTQYCPQDSMLSQIPSLAQRHTPTLVA